MDTANLTVLISGSGTNLQAIIDAITAGHLNARINLVISNKIGVQGLTRAENAGIPTLLMPYTKDEMTRSQYDQVLLEVLQGLRPKTHLIVLAGWMHILSPSFLNKLQIPIINLHPALPGEFPGKDGIGDAFVAFQRGEVIRTGCMVHYVVPEIDAGEVITQCEVPIEKEDTLDSLRERVRFMEKPVLLQGIMKVLIQLREEGRGRLMDWDVPKFPVTRGKVRDVWDLGYGVLAMVHSNRFSSFDRQICEVPLKGRILTDLSAWWFNQTKHLIPNHLIQATENIMFVKKCRVIPIEVVVRAYITGSTETSLWTHYARGERKYCGFTFPDGLIKNQRLDCGPIVTPTTKGKVDVPISADEIVAQNICTTSEWNYISSKAIELFNFAAQIADQKGLILVDTKMEFGVDQSGQIIVIDELFTCDSSRYWSKESYQERFLAGLAPKSLDKDIIREYVRERCDPYHIEVLPEIPPDLIEYVCQEYLRFYQLLTGRDELLAGDGLCQEVENRIDSYFRYIHSPIVIIITEDNSPHNNVKMDKLGNELEKLGLYSRWLHCSPIQDTGRLLYLLENLDDEAEGRHMVVCCLDENGVLSSVVEGNVHCPVVRAHRDRDYPLTAKYVSQILT